MVKRGDMLSVKDVQEILGVELIGVIERDESVIIAANTGEPVVYNVKAKAGAAFSRIAARITGEVIPFPDFNPTGIFGKLSRLAFG